MARSGGSAGASGSTYVNNKTDILGADILAGLYYTHNQFDLFAKAGMMVETLWSKANDSLNFGIHYNFV